MYDTEKLVDPDGAKIIVINPGEYNRDAGPDFFNARINIDGTEWAGNIEIHIRSSHFDSHGHQNDPAYNNVILHVVAENDKIVFNSRGEELLTVALRFNSELYTKYLQLVNTPYIIACQDEIKKIENIFISNWLSSLVVERLSKKEEMILNILAETSTDWEETFYRLLSRYFGFRVNTEPFEMLARSLPFKIIRKHADNRFQIEALLFGMAGFLEEGLFKEALSDQYYIDLIKEYRMLSAKYSLHPMHGWLWKFSRLRPANFPTIRISQLAAMLSVTGGLFSNILEATEVSQLNSLFEVKASEYWDSHYVFGKRTRESVKNTGVQATDIMLINAVIPVLFLYGKLRYRPDLSERALEFLDKIPAEENSITEEWKIAGIKAESAFSSQALLQLRNEYCKRRRCLRCHIGSRLICMGTSLIEESDLMLEP